MKRILIALSISLAGCASLLSPTVAPAPLSHSTIDEKSLLVAFQTFDTMLTAVDRLVAAGVIKPGSPRALQIADAIAKAKVAFRTASAVQQTGSSQDYLVALGNAQIAIANINLLLKGN